jgi:hypothetical protein
VALRRLGRHSITELVRRRRDCSYLRPTKTPEIDGHYTLWHKERTKVNYLIDTNIVIPLEPTSAFDLGVNTIVALEFHRLVSRQHHGIFVHPAIEHDLGRDKDAARAEARRTLLARYQMLSHPPPPSKSMIQVVGSATYGSRDWVDDRLLAALVGDAVDYLVTEDEGIHKKAQRLNLASRTLHLTEAISLLHALFDEHPAPPPAVEQVEVHALNERDPIFDGFRADYAPGFDSWLRKCKRQHRSAYIIRSPSRDRLAAVCILDRQDKNEFDLDGKVLKICTFKVAEEYNGNRFGELLLKPVFDYLFQNEFDHVFLTMFPKHRALGEMLSNFGFTELPCRTKLGEVVLAKNLRWNDEDRRRLGPLEFNRLFGPWVTKLEDNPLFIVPIRPTYHALLFPEVEPQGHLFPGHAACGNSIKKAYLCNAVLTSIRNGNNLLFYRSGDIRGVTAIGIVEGTIRSSHPKEIIYYVGKRTVYSSAQITEMCKHKPVLAIKFRRVAFLPSPIPQAELETGGCLSGVPQSIQKVPRGGVKWLRQRIKM